MKNIPIRYSIWRLKKHGVKLAQKFVLDHGGKERFQKQIDTRNKIVELLREHGGKE